MRSLLISASIASIGFMLVAACSSPSTTPSEMDAGSVDASEMSDASVDASVSVCESVPDSVVGQRLQWIVDAVNSGTSITLAEYSENTTTSFRVSVTVDEFRSALGLVAQSGLPVRIAGMLRRSTPQQVSPLFIGTSGDTWAMQLTTESVAPYRLDEIALEAASTDSLVATFDDFTAAATTNAGMLVAQIEDGVCVPIFEYDTSNRRAVASVFKLYVLGALANEVRLGNLDWNQTVTVESSLKSTGQTASDPDGTELALVVLARRMIERSDNTATDHVMALVGREKVEEFLGSMGHLDPGINTPFLTARDAFVFKYMDPALGAEYCGTTDLAIRRNLLVQSAATAINEAKLPDAAALPQPIYVDCVEWFVSPEELCSALASLVEMANEPGLSEVRDILAPAPLVAEKLDPNTFPYVAFKPGSEPGVLANAWYLERCDGQTFVVTAAFNDETTALVNPPDIIAIGVFMSLLQPSEQSSN